LLTHRQTDRQTNSGKNITSLAEVKTKNRPTDGPKFANPNMTAVSPYFNRFMLEIDQDNMRMKFLA